MLHHQKTPLTVARAPSPEAALAAVRQQFQAVEISVPRPAQEASWAALLSQNDLIVMGHGPAEGDPLDVEGLENRYVPELEQAFDSARRLGCWWVTIHFWLDSRFIPPPIRETKLALLDRVVEMAAAKGVSVHLENLSESWADLAEAFERIPELGLTLDLGHAQLLTDTNLSVSIIEGAGVRLRHLHLHDNHGGDDPAADLHLPPGRGVVPFERIFHKLKSVGYCGPATLELAPEQWRHARDWFRARWREA